MELGGRVKSINIHCLPSRKKTLLHRKIHLLGLKMGKGPLHPGLLACLFPSGTHSRHFHRVTMFVCFAFTPKKGKKPKKRNARPTQPPTPVRTPNTHAFCAAKEEEFFNGFRLCGGDT